MLIEKISMPSICIHILRLIFTEQNCFNIYCTFFSVSKGSILQGRISVTTQECGIPNVEDIASVPVARVASGMQSKPGKSLRHTYLLFYASMLSFSF